MRCNKSTPARLMNEEADDEAGLQTQVKGIVKSVWEVRHPVRA